MWIINFIHSSQDIKYFSHYSIQFLRMTLSCTIIFKNKFQDLHEAQEKLSKLLPKSQTVISHYRLSRSIPSIESTHDFASRYFSIDSSSYLATSFSRFRNERHEILKSCLARIARVLRSSASRSHTDRNKIAGLRSPAGFVPKFPTVCHPSFYTTTIDICKL